MDPGFHADSYWSDRLEENFNLRGTGHLAYDERYNRWLYREKARALRRALQRVPTGNALDVGSGTGWVVSELKEAELPVEGCDISEPAVERLRERFPTTHFFQLALGDEPIDRPDGRFAIVTLMDVSYHVVDDAKWLNGLRELARVLRPGGALIVSDGLGDYDRDPAPHVRFRSLKTWQEAARVGLEITDVMPYFRWLSRDRESGPFRRLPDGPRGALEFTLERLVPRSPHMRCAVLRRRQENAAAVL